MIQVGLGQHHQLHESSRYVQLMSFNELEDFEFPEEQQKWIRVKCPACKNLTGVEIIFGYPGGDLGMASRRGDVVLGGCLLPLDGNDPNRECTSCGQQWGGSLGRRGRPPWPEEVTPSQEAAYSRAERYIDELQAAWTDCAPHRPEVGGISQRGMVQYLSSSTGGGFSEADATFAAERVRVNWFEQARLAAEVLLPGFRAMPDLIRHLTSREGAGFTRAEANYAAMNLNFRSY